jgi:FkbM family methyltransferase
MEQVNAVLPDGTKFDFFVYRGVDRYISARIQKRGSWEPFVTAIMLSLLRPGDAFVDIGANIGWYTVASALKVGKTGQVIAFEPDPDNADMLERNVVLNDLHNVRLFRCALAESTGQMSLVKSATNMGDHRLDSTSERSASVNSSNGSSASIDISVDTLDRVIADNGINLAKARILKVDTQGAEVLVLRGARETLAALSNECAIFIEFSPNLLRRHAHDASDSFIRIISQMDRTMYLVNSRFRTIHPVSKAELNHFVETSSGASEDIGLDLILAPRDENRLQDYCRIYAPLVKSRILRA